MEGVAISFSAWESGLREFIIQDFQGAGVEAKTLQSNCHCIEVMTGASLPDATDCVIRFEDLEIKNKMAKLSEGLSLKQYQHVHLEGSDYKAGEQVLGAFSRIQSPQLAVAASIGKTNIELSSSPKIALISTGDELVAIDEKPKSFQIRRSNTHALHSMLFCCGFDDLTFFHLKDDKQSMLGEVRNILEDYDCLIFTGGVSKGKLDFVPEVLEELGVEIIFHGVKQRPGKPLLFALGPNKKWIFGLPGNPVSTLISAHKYILPALAKAQGEEERALPHAILKADFKFKPELTFFLPVKVIYTPEGTIDAYPKKVNGSGDYATLAQSDGFIELPENQKVFLPGEAYPLHFWNRLP
jgi:molybdopterin molybdotransferase